MASDEKTEIDELFKGVSADPSNDNVICKTVMLGGENIRRTEISVNLLNEWLTNLNTIAEVHPRLDATDAGFLLLGLNNASSKVEDTIKKLQVLTKKIQSTTLKVRTKTFVKDSSTAATKKLIDELLGPKPSYVAVSANASATTTTNPVETKVEQKQLEVKPTEVKAEPKPVQTKVESTVLGSSLSQMTLRVYPSPASLPMLGMGCVNFPGTDPTIIYIRLDENTLLHGKGMPKGSSTIDKRMNFCIRTSCGPNCHQIHINPAEQTYQSPFYCPPSTFVSQFIPETVSTKKYVIDNQRLEFVVPEPIALEKANLIQHLSKIIIPDASVLNIWNFGITGDNYPLLLNTLIDMITSMSHTSALIIAAMCSLVRTNNLLKKVRPSFDRIKHQARNEDERHIVEIIKTFCSKIYF